MSARKQREKVKSDGKGSGNGGIDAEDWRDQYNRTKRELQAQVQEAQHERSRRIRAEENLKRLQSLLSENPELSQLRGRDAPKGAASAVELQQQLEDAQESLRRAHSQRAREAERAAHFKRSADSLKQQLHRLHRVHRSSAKAASHAFKPSDNAQSGSNQDAVQLQSENARLREQLARAQQQAASATARLLSSTADTGESASQAALPSTADVHTDKQAQQPLEEPARSGNAHLVHGHQADTEANVLGLKFAHCNIAVAQNGKSNGEAIGTLETQAVAIDCDTGVAYTNESIGNKGVLARSVGAIVGYNTKHTGVTTIRPGGRENIIQIAFNGANQSHHLLEWSKATSKSFAHLLQCLVPACTEAEQSIFGTAMGLVNASLQSSNLLFSLEHAASVAAAADNDETDVVLRELRAKIECNASCGTGVRYSGTLQGNQLVHWLQEQHPSCTQRQLLLMLQRSWRNDPLGRGLTSREMCMMLGLTVASEAAQPGVERILRKQVNETQVAAMLWHGSCSLDTLNVPSLSGYVTNSDTLPVYENNGRKVGRGVMKNGRLHKRMHSSGYDVLTSLDAEMQANRQSVRETLESVASESNGMLHHGQIVHAVQRLALHSLDDEDARFIADLICVGACNNPEGDGLSVEVSVEYAFAVLSQVYSPHGGLSSDHQEALEEANVCIQQASDKLTSIVLAHDTDNDGLLLHLQLRPVLHSIGCSHSANASRALLMKLFASDATSSARFNSEELLEVCFDGHSQNNTQGQFHMPSVVMHELHSSTGDSDILWNDKKRKIAMYRFDHRSIPIPCAYVDHSAEHVDLKKPTDGVFVAIEESIKLRKVSVQSCVEAARTLPHLAEQLVSACKSSSCPNGDVEYVASMLALDCSDTKDISAVEHGLRKCTDAENAVKNAPESKCLPHQLNNVLRKLMRKDQESTLASLAVFRSFDIPALHRNAVLSFYCTCAAVETLTGALDAQQKRLLMSHLRLWLCTNDGVSFEDLMLACGCVSVHVIPVQSQKQSTNDDEASSPALYPKQPSALSSHHERTTGGRITAVAFFDKLKRRSPRVPHSVRNARQITQDEVIRQSHKLVPEAKRTDVSFFVGMMCLFSTGSNWTAVERAADECLDAASEAQQGESDALTTVLAGLHELVERNRDTTLSLFRKFDRNGSFYLEPDELITLLSQAVKNFSLRHHRVLLTHLRQLDLDKDGRISYGELRQALYDTRQLRPGSPQKRRQRDSHRSASGAMDTNMQHDHAKPSLESVSIAAESNEEIRALRQELQDTRAALERERQEGKGSMPGTQPASARHESHGPRENGSGSRPFGQEHVVANESIDSLCTRHGGSKEALEALKARHEKLTEQLDEANKLLNEEQRSAANMKAELRRLQSERDAAKDFEPLVEKLRQEKADAEKENYELLSNTMHPQNEMMQENKKLKQSLLEAEQAKAGAEKREAQLRNQMQTQQTNRNGEDVVGDNTGENDRLKAENERLRVELEAEQEKLQIYQATGGSASRRASSEVRVAHDEEELSEESAKAELRRLRDNFVTMDDQLQHAQANERMREEEVEDLQQALADERERRMDMESKLDMQAQELSRLEVQARLRDRASAASLGNDLSDIKTNENVFELAVETLELVHEQFTDSENQLHYLAIDFFEHETQVTHAGSGFNPKIATTMQFVVPLNRFFARHLLEDFVRVELYSSLINEPVALGALPLRKVAEDARRRTARHARKAVELPLYGSERCIVAYARVSMRLLKAMASLIEEAAIAGAGGGRSQDGAVAFAAEQAAEEPHLCPSLEVVVISCKRLQPHRPEMQDHMRPFVTYRLPGMQCYQFACSLGSVV